MTKSSLDLGCGNHPKNPFGAEFLFGIDVRSLRPEIKKSNLFLESIPYADGSFDFVTAFDFIEHVPRVLAIYDDQNKQNKIINPFINLMNEIYRVLKLDGVFFSRTPAFPHPEAFQDPTHCNIITETTFKLYFNDHYPVAHIYGFIGAFAIIDQCWEGAHLCTKLQKKNKPDLSKFGANLI
jgi:SAM-dependent methyltransferase